MTRREYYEAVKNAEKLAFVKEIECETYGRAIKIAIKLSDGNGNINLDSLIEEFERLQDECA